MITALWRTVVLITIANAVDRIPKSSIATSSSGSVKPLSSRAGRRQRAGHVQLPLCETVTFVWTPLEIVACLLPPPLATVTVYWLEPAGTFVNVITPLALVLPLAE